jgi:hypothetical protein
MARLLTRLRRPRTVTAIRDTFTAADSTLIENRLTDSGHAWIVKNGTCAITSNRAVPNISSTLNVKTNANTANYTYQATVNLGADGVTRGLGLRFRYKNSTDYWYFKVNRTSAGSGTMQLTKVVANSGSNVGSTTFAAAASTDYVLKVVCSGSSIKTYIDGVLKHDVTDTQHQTETWIGIRADGANATGWYVDTLSLQHTALASYALYSHTFDAGDTVDYANDGDGTFQNSITGTGTSGQSVSNTVAASGAYSLKTSVTGADQGDQGARNFMQVPQDQFRFTVRFYLGSDLTAISGFYMLWQTKSKQLVGDSGTSPMWQLNIERRNGAMRLKASDKTALVGVGAGTEYTQDLAVLTAATWHTLDLFVKVRTDTTGEFLVKQDGITIFSFSGVKTVALLPVTMSYNNYCNGTTPTGHDIYFDLPYVGTR